MGGSNSTRWDGIRTRSVVESCYSIAAPYWDSEVVAGPGLYDELRWERGNLYVTCMLLPEGDSPRVLLRFRRYSRTVEQGVRLCFTRPHFGGRRWWFVCPQCSARVGLLHLPSNSYHFLCRKCHNLSYESSQSSRGSACALWKILAAESGSTTRFARDGFRWRNGGYVWTPLRPYFM